MLYEPNYIVMIILFLAIIQVAVYPSLLAIDAVKGRPFRPVYRFFWPFVLVAEVMS